MSTPDEGTVPTPAGSGDVAMESWGVKWKVHQSSNPDFPDEYDVYEDDYSVIGDGFIRRDQAESIVEKHNDAIDRATASLREELGRAIIAADKHGLKEYDVPRLDRFIEETAKERDQLRAENARLTRELEQVRARRMQYERFWREATDNNEFLQRDNHVLRQRIAELEADKRRLDNGLCAALQGLERIQRRAFGRETPQSIELQNMAGDIRASITSALDAGKGEG